MRQRFICFPQELYAGDWRASAQIWSSHACPKLDRWVARAGVFIHSPARPLVPFFVRSFALFVRLRFFVCLFLRLVDLRIHSLKPPSSALHELANWSFHFILLGRYKNQAIYWIPWQSSHLPLSTVHCSEVCCATCFANKAVPSAVILGKFRSLKRRCYSFIV